MAGIATAPGRTAKPGPVSEGRGTIQQALLFCGILAALLHVAMNVFIPMLWRGYSFASQVVSELSAIDAPTRPLWVPLGVVYCLLMIAFGWGIWDVARGNRPLRVVGALLVVSSIVGLAWPPMHLRPVLAAGGGTLTDTLHIVWTMAWGVCMMLAIGFGAAALGRRFRLYSIVTLVVLVVFGVLTALDGPRISANLPTPLVGVWERINMGAAVLWIMVLAITLLRKPAYSTPSPHPRRGGQGVRTTAQGALS